MYCSDKFDWEAQRDAETIARCAEIEADPERLRKAQACIKASVESEKKALGMKPSPKLPSRGGNPATVARIHPKF